MQPFTHRFCAEFEDPSSLDPGLSEVGLLEAEGVLSLSISRRNRFLGETTVSGLGGVLKLKKQTKNTIILSGTLVFQKLKVELSLWRFLWRLSETSQLERTWMLLMSQQIEQTTCRKGSIGRIVFMAVNFLGYLTSATYVCSLMSSIKIELQKIWRIITTYKILSY